MSTTQNSRSEKFTLVAHIRVYLEISHARMSEAQQENPGLITVNTSFKMC